PLCPSQPGCRCLRAKERCAQIRVERGVPDFLGRGYHTRRQKIGRAVHQNVEPPKVFSGLVNQALDFVYAAKIGSKGNSPLAKFFYFLDGILSLRLRSPVMDGNIRALFGKSQRHSTAQALRRTCNQGHLALQRKAHAQRKYHDTNTLARARQLDLSTLGTAPASYRFTLALSPLTLLSSFASG